MFRTIYGEKYPIRVYYEPQELTAANETGRIISSVAKTLQGRVVGHTAHWDGIELEFDRAKELLRHVHEDWKTRLQVAAPPACQ